MIKVKEFQQRKIKLEQQQNMKEYEMKIKRFQEKDTKFLSLPMTNLRRQKENVIENANQSESMSDDIAYAAEHGDEMEVQSILHESPPEQKGTLVTKALPAAIKNNDFNMFNNILLHHKITSKTSSKHNPISDPLICLYECIDENNAVMTKVLVDTFKHSNYENSEIIEDLLRQAIDRGCNNNIVCFLNQLWTGNSKFDKKLFQRYLKMLKPLLSKQERLTKMNHEQLCLHTVIKFGLVEFNEMVWKMLFYHFPESKVKIQQLKEYIGTETDPNMRQYYLEFLFSSDSSPATYEALHVSLSKLSSKHSFMTLPAMTDNEVKTHIITAVDENRTNEAALSEKAAIEKAIDGFMDNLSKVIGYRRRSFECNPVRVGSSYEKTRPFRPNEFDILLVLTEIEKMFGLKFLESFVFLFYKGTEQAPEDIVDHHNNESYLSADSLKSRLNEIIRAIMMDDENSLGKPFAKGQANENVQNFPNHIKALSPDKRLSIDLLGFFIKKKKFSTLRLLWRGDHFIHMPITIDIVPAIQCRDCPVPIPNHAFLKQPNEMPLYCVAFGYQTGFQVCHTVQEATILRDAPEELVIGYTYAKAMRRSVALQSKISKPYIRELNDYEDVLTSYMIKQSFLFLTQDWKPQNSTSSIQWTIQIYKRLRRFLADGKMVPEFMLNSKISDKLECVFRLDETHLNLRCRELQRLLAIIDRILELLRAQVIPHFMTLLFDKISIITSVDGIDLCNENKSYFVFISSFSFISFN